jgi:two-component sensor histidine kinase/CheY-like chemotaxis protein
LSGSDVTEEVPHLLYIDDDEGLRRLATLSLKRRGFRVTAAASGREGVELAMDGKYDVVTVDHYMPIQDGLETLLLLNAVPEPPPVVYVTGSEDSNVAVAALKAGAVDYVVKSPGEPFFDLLAQTLRAALRTAQLSRAKTAAERELRATNERLAALLNEVNHRVANSLQLVSAFVHMQAGAVADPSAKDALENTNRRIQAIAQVHRRLYTSDDVQSVEMSEYLSSLVSELEEAWSTPASPRRLRLTADPIRLKTDRAVPVGVIVSELVANACKYAYDPDCSGEVRIELKRDGDSGFCLAIEDDGCGLPADGAVKGTGLGTKLVKAMAQSLSADLSYDPDHKGVKAVLRAEC